MIWNSILMMTVIDLVVMALTLVAFWSFFQHKKLLKELRLFYGLSMVLLGLLFISFFYLADFVIMHLFPVFMPFPKALEIMRDLHLNYTWIVSVLGIGSTVAGLVYLFTLLLPHIASLQNKCENTNEELQAALENIKTLKGLIPICSSCKNVRDDNGFWNKIEVYIRDHSDAEFTHGYCPTCLNDFLDKARHI